MTVFTIRPVITCADCGCETPRTGRNQKRCPECRVANKGKHDYASRIRRHGADGERVRIRTWAHGGIQPPTEPAPCPICGVVAPLVLDHDHACCATRNRSCGKCFRGFVCRTCNSGMGFFGDDPDRLLAAAMHLLRFRRHWGAA